MITREQKRAKHALVRSEDTRDKDADFAKKLPVLIQTCGLAQAMAFAQAKDKAPKLREALEDWIIETIPLPPQSPKRSILDRIVGGEKDFLFRATDEALAYLFWIARFCEAKSKKGRQNS